MDKALDRVLKIFEETVVNLGHRIENDEGYSYIHDRVGDLNDLLDTIERIVKIKESLKKIKE